MKKERKILIDEHDMTKTMLAILREFDEPEVVETEVSESEEASEEDYESEKKSFMETVTNKVNFDDEGDGLKIYRKNKNAIFSGAFLQDMGNLKWRMVLNEANGLYIDTTGLQITDETLHVLNSMNGYYKNWSNEWGLKMNQDYKYKGKNQF